MKTKILILIMFFITLTNVEANDNQFPDYRVTVNSFFQQIDATVINYTDEIINCSGIIQAWTVKGRFETHFFSGAVFPKRTLNRFYRILDFRDRYRAFPNNTIRCF